MNSHRSLAELDTALLQAHEKAANHPSEARALVELYYQAYQLTLRDEEMAAYFYLTNAYVYALDTNHPQAVAIETLLKDANRL